MVELIFHHPIFVPLTKIPNPPIPLRLLHTTFERIEIDNDILETKIIGDRIVPIHKSTFLKAIGVAKDIENFKVEEPTTEEFLSFLDHIGYSEEYKAEKFKKSVISAL